MRFSKIRNLQPVITKASFVIQPGRTPQPLVRFDVAEPSIPEFHYNLEVSEEIGDTTLKANPEFPYLIPVGENHPVGLLLDNREIIAPYRNIFKMFSGDTVYAMRKGRMVASPGIDFMADRISLNNTLEILHADGTVMVYYNISPDEIFIKPGEYVLPGQPLGLVNANNLEIELYEFIGKGKLKKLDIHYLTNNGISRYSEISENEIVPYPDSILQKELTRSERRRYR
jgi:hypothetical protein